MAFWNWTSDLELGIEAIDQQHRRLVDYINELHEACRSGDRDRVETVLIGLVDYTVTHFTFEERLQEQSGYPLAEPHKATHRAFTERAQRHLDAHRRGEEVGKRVLSQLQVWLQEHIKRDDRDYARAVQATLKPPAPRSWLSRTARRLFG